MPFDRLVLAVDRWAAANGCSDDVFAQICSGGAEPKAIRWTRFLEPDEYRERLESCDVLVAHAGTGSIFAALELGLPIVVMPRHAKLRETRNDHQIATAKHFEEQGKVIVAWDEDELLAKLEGLDDIVAAGRIGEHASPELIAALSAFIDDC